MPEVKASELVQELIEKWSNILAVITETAKCPFLEELMTRTNQECYMSPPSHPSSVCGDCLATHELCVKYSDMNEHVRNKIVCLIEGLKEHKIIYERHEK